MWLAFLGEKKKATIYGWYQCIKDDELTRRLAELENLLFLAKKWKKKISFHIQNNVTNIERGWSCEKERSVWGKGSENKRVGIKAGGLKRREEQFLFI